eukprot:CAMPEP_0170197682 /NCGR_PEP_ID=MMETSP0040_2-20121228/66953_1 /TAXON_ID=641309 /ORGANISM="Lotharella oceanica, Strain CCMP622" /LENGTH=71 /DNA_ID=CAMNT_0010447407 /DNA_START=118 /DNA_END=333 /DNA_ORIENTATION=-
MGMMCRGHSQATASHKGHDAPISIHVYDASRDQTPGLDTEDVDEEKLFDGCSSSTLCILPRICPSHAAENK